MDRAQQWILPLSLWLAFFQLFLNLGSTMLDEHDGRKLTTNDRNPGFISIDCGSDNNYLDPKTSIFYQTDSEFVKTGENHRVLPSTNTDVLYYEAPLKTLRSFPEGKKNCYTLKPKQGKHNSYLIQACFIYGNYDAKNQTPVFELYLGVNYWTTIDMSNEITQIIHTPTTDTIQVCLVKTNDLGIPYISALELRPLSDSIYQTPSPSQSLLLNQGSFDVASNGPVNRSRYKDDIYDRSWYNTSVQGGNPLYESVDIDPQSTSDSYKVPIEVLRSAARSFNLSVGLSYDYDASWRHLEKSAKYYVYFHFLEIEQLPPGQKRIMNITVNDENIVSHSITLEYLKPQTVSTPNATQGYVRFNINATSASDAPPILNAFEVYELKSLLSSPTDKRDIDAILAIQNTYKISKVYWQGDPCLPKHSEWEGLSCSSDMNNNTRISSVNLSSNNLAGQIATSFLQLTELESLDLSFNDLSGSLPEFLAELPKLKMLNLTGNKLTGSIPKGLKEKSDVTLQLSLADNPGLCLTDPCKKQKYVIPLVASILALIIVLLVSVAIWIFKTKKLKVVFTDSTKEVSLELKHRAFSYSKVLKITDNFQNLIGEGGFGKVYLGTLKNDTKVAVKLLSQSSTQGHREFRSELELLMVVHHRHLVSLIGYCEEGGVRALIYEYMANGNLQQHLSDKNPNVLKWKERLQIALDAACGLDYLHNGCKSPIVHRDLKTSNILLNENMQAKIADFGLSRAFVNDIDTHISTRPAGTIGYVDPEFQTSGNLTKKSDIYSFGIILLELITGKPAIRRELGTFSHILQWVNPKLESRDIQSIVDPRLRENYSADSAWKLLEIAMSCTPSSAIQRPDISHVVAELKQCLALEITVESTKGNTNSSRSLDMSSLQFDSEMMPSAR